MLHCHPWNWFVRVAVLPANSRPKRNKIREDNPLSLAAIFSYAGEYHVG